VLEGLAGVTSKPPIKPLFWGSLNFPQKVDNPYTITLLSKQLKETKFVAPFNSNKN